jgi:hypothetical protein
MSADTNDFYRCVAKVENLQDPEEELLAEDSPIKRLPNWSSFQANIQMTTANMSSVVTFKMPLLNECIISSTLHNKNMWLMVITYSTICHINSEGTVNVSETVSVSSISKGCNG